MPASGRNGELSPRENGLGAATGGFPKGRNIGVKSNGENKSDKK